MSRKKKYYSCKKIKSLKCQYNMLLGQRANGKSYSVKSDVLENCYVNNKTFVYLRRWKDDVKVANVNSYFSDAPIEKITGGEWDGVIARGGKIYFTQTDEDGEEVRSPEPIGWYCSLNDAERYKSLVFENCEDIIFEEFIGNRFLVNECERLQQFVSTVFRNRGEGRVWMIGNTLTRVVPYFEEWSLEGVLKQKKGTIEVYNYNTQNGVVKLAVELCEAVNNIEGAGFFFGRAEKQIVSGEWEVFDFPKLQKPLKEYEMVYEIKVECMKFNFCIQLLVDGDGGRILYVYPMTKNRYIKRIITDKVSDDIFITTGFSDKFKPEIFMKELFDENRICYSDNLTGTDFNNLLQYLSI